MFKELFFLHTFVRMFKKSLTISFLFLACSLVIGHSLFRHTHVKEHHHNDKHHHHNDEHNDENGLSLFFSLFNHTSDTFSNGLLEGVVKIVNEVPNELLILDTAEIFSDSSKFYYKKELVRNKEPLIFISPHLLSLQFRGPPKFS